MYLRRTVRPYSETRWEAALIAKPRFPTSPRRGVLLFLGGLWALQAICTAGPNAVAQTPADACDGVAPGNPCIPGSGSAVSDCVAEWLAEPVPAAARKGIPRARVVCYEGDPRCDADADLDNASCTVRLDVCINTSDARLAA